MAIVNITISAILSLLFPGAGQIYNGQTKKGFWFFGIALGMWILSLMGLPVLSSLGLPLVRVWSIVDAVVVSNGIYRGKKDLDFVRDWKGFVQIAVVIVIPYFLMFANVMLTQMNIAEYLNQSRKPPEDLSKVQSEIEEYLEKKYGQEFVVGEAKYNYQIGDFSLIAHPKDNPQLKFGAIKSPVTGEFDDSYTMILWSQQSEEEIKPLIDQLYSDRWDFSSEVVPEKSLDNKLDFKNHPDYKDARKKYPDRMRQNVTISLFKDLNSTNRDEELEKVYRLIQFFREKGIEQFLIDIGFYEERLLKEKGRDIEVSGEYLDYLRHRIQLTHDDAKTIHTAKDLEQFLKERPK